MTAEGFAFPASSETLREMFTEVVNYAKRSAVPLGFGYLQDDVVDESRPVELWITCRMTYVFSLAAMLGIRGSRELAAHGIEALTEYFRDDEFGGWFSAINHELDETGAVVPVEGPKEAYAHAFVILASNAATEADIPGAAPLLDLALGNQYNRWWDENVGRVVESYDRTFSETEAYRGLNSNMHTTEAYLAVADSKEKPIMVEGALRILAFACRAAEANDWRIPEHFDEGWQPILDYNIDAPDHPFRPYGTTPGHAFEWGRLMLHARGTARAMGFEAPGWLLDSATKLIMRAAADSWNVDGNPGFIYTTDHEGDPVVSARMHWVAAEAIGAVTVLLKVLEQETSRGDMVADYETSQLQPKLRGYLETWWDWMVGNHLEGPGQWIHELDAQNQKAEATWPGKPDAYHVAQMLLLPQLDPSPTFAAAVSKL